MRQSYPEALSQYGGKIDYDNPKTVSLDDLPDDIQKCTVLVDGEMRWEVEIGLRDSKGGFCF